MNALRDEIQSIIDAREALGADFKANQTKLQKLYVAREALFSDAQMVASAADQENVKHRLLVTSEDYKKVLSELDELTQRAEALATRAQRVKAVVGELVSLTSKI